MESMDWTQPVAKDTVEKKCCEADSGLIENQLDELECVFWNVFLSVADKKTSPL